MSSAHPRDRFNHTRWVAIFTPTDRPTSVHNRVVIDVLVAFWRFMLRFGFFFGCSGFCHRTESELFLFSSNHSPKLELSSILIFFCNFLFISPTNMVFANIMVPNTFLSPNKILFNAGIKNYYKILFLLYSSNFFSAISFFNFQPFKTFFKCL